MEKFHNKVVRIISQSIILDWLEPYKNTKASTSIGSGFFIDNNGYDELLNYKDRYFGIASHLISQPIQFLTYEFVGDVNKMTDKYAYLVSRHISFFIIFIICLFLLD